MNEQKTDSVNAAAFVAKRKMHLRGQDGAERRFQVTGGLVPHHGPRFERVSEPAGQAARRRRFVPITPPPTEGSTVVTTLAEPTARADAERTEDTEAFEVFTPLADAQDSAPIVGQARSRRGGKREGSGRTRAGQAPERAAAAGSGAGGSGGETTALDGENGPERINIYQRIQEIVVATPLDRTDEAPPLVDQVTDTIRTIITSAPEEAIEGSMVPEPDQLDELFGIHRKEDREVTRQAIKTLHEENLVFTLTIPERGNLGTFVVRNEPAPRIPREPTDDIVRANIDQDKTKTAQTRIIECIEKLIATRQLKPGDAIPSSARMGELFNTGASNATAALSTPELETLLVRPGRGVERTVAELSPLTDIATFLKVHTRERGRTPAEESATPAAETQAAQDITTFLTEYVQTRDNGQALPSNSDLAALLGVNPGDITHALEYLSENNLVSTQVESDSGQPQTYVVSGGLVPESTTVVRTEITPGAQAQKAVEIAFKYGILRTGDKLPPVREWTREYGIPYSQVFKLQNNLREAGLISGRTKRGTVVIGEPLTGEQMRTAKERVIEHIERLIAIGELKTGDRPPRVNALANLFDTSPANIATILRGTELGRFLARDGKDLVVADMEPLTLVNLFLQEYVREGGKTPTETSAAQGRTATQEITTFLREYIQTRDEGEPLPSIVQLTNTFGVSRQPIADAFTQLQNEQLIVSGPQGTRISGEYVTDPMRIATYTNARLESLAQGEALPSIRTIVYELATLEGIKPVLIESADQIAALMQEYIKFLRPGETLLSHNELADILGTSTRPVQNAYKQLQRARLIDTDHMGTRVAGEYQTESQRLEADIRQRLTSVPPGGLFQSQQELAAELGTTRAYLQPIYERLTQEGLLYTERRRTRATGAAYIQPEQSTEDE